jgi:DNA-binding transcriptional ArsR family regulator
MAAKEQRRKAKQNRFTAMSHPLRAEIFRILNDRTASPAELARELGEEIPLVNHHVKRLVKLDCAVLVAEKKVEGAGVLEHFYRATERHLVDTDEWDELHPVIAEGLVVEFMQRILDDFSASARAKMIGADQNFCLTRTPVIVDAAGRQAILDIHERARLEILKEQSRSAERMLTSGESGAQYSSSQGFFEVPPEAIA